MVEAYTALLSFEQAKVLLMPCHIAHTHSVELMLTVDAVYV
jgi:hypothetical protein